MIESRVGQSPILRWAGSKKKLIPLLAKSAPEKFGKYYEPFLGSAVMFLYLQPKRSVLSDFNCKLISFYRQMTEKPREIYLRASQLPRNKETYLRIRDEFNESSEDFISAVRFFFLNRHCFNGVYRENKRGFFNVPMGAKVGEFPSSSNFLAVSKLLATAKLICSDFETAIENAERNDFIYLDPPYSGSRRNYGEYGYGAFSKADEDRLCEALLRLSNRKVKIMLSYCNSESIEKVSKNFRIVRTNVHRSVAGVSSCRKSTQEIIAINYG